MNILNKLTINYLKKNKKRTIVTIIGIILSAAMLTAVTTLVISFQSFMVRVEQEEYGYWDSKFSDITKDKLKYIENNVDVTRMSLSNILGSVRNNYAKEEAKVKFIELREFDNEAFNTYRIRVLEGRLPKNNNEIVISEQYKEILKDVKDFEIGKKIKLDVGTRILANGEIATAYIPDTPDETLKLEFSKEYEIVGIIKMPLTIEYSGNAAISVITYLDKTTLSDNSIVTAHIDVEKKKEVYDISENIAKNIGMKEIEPGEYDGLNYNNWVLMYQGINDDSGINMTLYAIAGISIGLIMIGSIGVIYNSFAISVSERRKQFGMLISCRNY